MKQEPQQPVPTPSRVLDYATPDAIASINSRRCLLAARAFGLLPLLIGSAIFFGWMLARWEWLMVAGLLLVPAGTIAAIAGLVCIIIYWQVEHRIAPEDRRRIRRQCYAALGLILVNFPVAFLYGVVALNLHTREYITVINRSLTPIESFVLTGPGVNRDLGPIAPGKRASTSFRPAFDGSLTFTARMNEKTINDDVTGYVTPGMGGRHTVTFNPDGTHIVQPGP